MKIDIIKHTIINVCKSICYWKNVRERKFFKVIFTNMLHYKTTVLSRLWNTKIMDAKYWLKYYSRHLCKLCWNDLGKKVTKVMIKFIGKITEDNMFCFDTVDINKNKAKKMEWLKKVRDWSTGTFWNWFVLHSVSIKWIPLLFTREPVEADDKNVWVRMEIFKSQIDTIVSIYWTGYWILADRGYDDYKKYAHIIDSSLNFAIRLKTNRNIEIVSATLPWKEWESQEKWEEREKQEKWLQWLQKTWNLGIWRYEVRIEGVKQSLFIQVEQTKWDKTPIRIISNIYDKNLVERYLKRWEIERIFKSEKQEFDLEKIGTTKITRTDNLIYMVQLCMWFSAYIMNKTESQVQQIQEGKLKENNTPLSSDTSSNISIKNFIQKSLCFLKQKSLTWNRNSIIPCIAYYMKKICIFWKKAWNIFRKTKKRKKTTLYPDNPDQLAFNFTYL